MYVLKGTNLLLTTIFTANFTETMLYLLFTMSMELQAGELPLVVLIRNPVRNVVEFYWRHSPGKLIAHVAALRSLGRWCKSAIIQPQAIAMASIASVIFRWARIMRPLVRPIIIQTLP